MATALIRNPSVNLYAFCDSTFECKKKIKSGEIHKQNGKNGTQFDSDREFIFNELHNGRLKLNRTKLCKKTGV